MRSSKERLVIQNGDKSFEIRKSDLASRIHFEAENIVDRIDESLAFYTKPIRNDLHPLQGIWDNSIIGYLNYVEDEILISACLKISEITEKYFRINKDLLKILLSFWGYSDSESDEDYRKIGRKRYRIKNGDPLPWTDLPEFQQQIPRLFDLKKEASSLEVEIIDSLVRVYNFSYIKFFGSQTAKDNIDRSYASKPKRAIKYLEKAISYGRPTFMSYKAFNCLGDQYGFLEDYESAVEAYSCSIEDLEASTVGMSSHLRPVYLMRGSAYLKLGKRDEAVQDMEIALRDNINPKYYEEFHPEEYKIGLELLEEAES